MDFILDNEIIKVEFMECLLRRNRPMEQFVSRYIDCLQAPAPEQKQEQTPVKEDKQPETPNQTLQCFEQYIQKHTIEGDMVIDLAKSIAYNTNIKYSHSNKYAPYLKQIIEKNQKMEENCVTHLLM